MNQVALKPVNFGGKQYKIGEIIPEGVVDERRSLFLKKSGHIAEVASVNGAYAEDLNVNPNTLSIPLLQSKHELAVNAQQLLQFFATIQKTMEEAKIEIATMTEEGAPVLQLLPEVDSRKGTRQQLKQDLLIFPLILILIRNQKQQKKPKNQQNSRKVARRMTYNYFPDEINTNDVMKMRFELADTDVSKDEMSAALSDEEITAVLEQYPDNFKMAKLKLLEHMMFKYGPGRRQQCWSCLF